MKVVLLDLDGTLTQSHMGIIACAKRAMSDLGMQIPDDEEMMRFVGPSILESFQRNGMPEDLQLEGVKLYRKYYSEFFHTHGTSVISVFFFYQSRMYSRRQYYRYTGFSQFYNSVFT